jgi:folate-binding protein YgfZ
MTETPLHAHLVARGAVHHDDRGVVLPAHFGDPAHEYATLVQGVAVVDLGFRTLVSATGPDRVDFLQGMLTNDVAKLAPGSGCVALLLTIQGRVVADVRVAVLDDELRLDVDVRVRDAFVGALSKLIIADDVELAAPEPAPALIGVEGPGASAVLGPDAAMLDAFAHRALDVGGVRVRLVAGGELGAGSFTLHVPAADGPRVWEALIAGGAVPCGMQALDARRVELGVPRIGVDMDEKTLAIELPVEALISTTKGCYLGQEVVARGTSRGHANRRLHALVLEGPVPPAGAALIAGDKEVGRLTTVVQAFGIGRPAALGLVRREHWDTGTVLAVAGSGATTARVADWPLA